MRIAVLHVKIPASTCRNYARIVSVVLVVQIFKANVEPFITVPSLDVRGTFCGVENTACNTVACNRSQYSQQQNKTQLSPAHITRPVNVAGGASGRPDHDSLVMQPHAKPTCRHSTLHSCSTPTA